MLFVCIVNLDKGKHFVIDLIIQIFSTNYFSDIQISVKSVNQLV